jgi:hypothetical protein
VLIRRYIKEAEARERADRRLAERRFDRRNDH